MVKLEQLCGVITAGTQCSAVPQSLHVIDVPLASCIARWNVKEKKRILCFQAHSESIICVKQWKHFICTGSFSTDLKLWTSDWKLLDTVEKTGELHVVYASWNSDGTLLATCHRDDIVRIWKVDHEHKKLQLHCKLEGKYCHTCEWWSQSLLLLSPIIELEQTSTSNHQQNNDIQKKIVKLNQSLVLFNALTQRIENNNVVLFNSPSESVVMVKSVNHVAIGRTDGTVYILNCGDNPKHEKLAIERVLTARKSRIRSLAFSSDGSRLLTPGGDGTLNIYETTTGDLLASLPAPTGNLTFLGFCLENENFIWCSNEFSIGYLDSQQINNHLIHFTHEITTNAIDWHLNGKWLASGDITGNVFLWDIPSSEDSQIPFSLTDPVLKTKVEGDSIRALIFCPSGIFVYYGTLSGTLYSWNLETQENNLETTLDGSVTCIRWHDQMMAASTIQGRVYLYSKVAPRESALKALTVFEAANPGLEIWSLAFSPDGKYLATASEDTTASVWDLEGKRIKHLKGHVNAVTCVDWQQTEVGEILATCSDDRTVRVYSAKEDFALFHVFQASDLYITYLALEKMSAKIAATTEDGYVYIFCLKKKECLLRKKLHAGSVEGLRTHPNSPRFATCSSDCTILISSIQTML